MARRKEQTTPHPPATPEFGSVVPSGPSHTYPSAGQARVWKFSVGRHDNNVYVVACDHEAVIVDAAAEADRILHEVEGLRVKAILQTHNHADHTGALQALVAALGVPVLAHPKDPMPVASEPLLGGERLGVGAARIAVLHTPGHTRGSLCYLLDRHLFSGDTLFPGGPGNTWGDPSAFQTIMSSLEQLFSLPDDTRVSPGHGLDTTIGRERPYLGTWRRRGW